MLSSMMVHCFELYFLLMTTYCLLSVSTQRLKVLNSFSCWFYFSSENMAKKGNFIPYLVM